MKTLMMTLVMGLVLGCMAWPVFSSEDDCEDGRRIGDVDRDPAGYRSKIYGTVEKLPETGLSGIWIVDGREFVVTERTRLEQEHGLLEPGAYVEIKGIKLENTFIADKIEVENGRRIVDGERDSAGYRSKIYGTVEKLPETGLAGIWIVNGREFVVTERTRLEQKHGLIEPGAYVEIKGIKLDNTFTADKIEVKRAKAGAFYGATEQKITGKVEKIPKGTLGTWVIGDKEVLVLKDTVLQEKNGKATLGSLVEVVGIKSGETFKAGRIETQQAIK